MKGKKGIIAMPIKKTKRQQKYPDTWDCTKLDSRVGNFWCKKEIKTTCEERLKRLIKKV